MRYIVKVADKAYTVEILDIHARPILAHVDGQEFEVHPEDPIKQITQQPNELQSVKAAMPSSSPGPATNELTAPLPGTIIEIFVKAGDSIEAGQVILVIEAMKMKNSIRSTRAGKITDVLVSAGQTVAHKQALVRFG